MITLNITNSIESFVPIVKKYEEVILVDANDSFTHNLVQAFLKLGAPVKVLRGHEVDIKKIRTEMGRYIVLSPGPGNPENSGIHKEVIREFNSKIPILGVCLGMQAINEVFGGKTIIANKPVHGKTSSISHLGTGIFQNIPSPTTVARYHSLIVSDVSDIFSIQSKYEGIVMAFNNPDLIITCVQFHPESFLTTDGLKMLENFLEGSI